MIRKIIYSASKILKVRTHNDILNDYYRFRFEMPSDEYLYYLTELQNLEFDRKDQRWTTLLQQLSNEIEDIDVKIQIGVLKSINKHQIGGVISLRKKIINILTDKIHSMNLQECVNFYLEVKNHRQRNINSLSSIIIYRIKEILLPQDQPWPSILLSNHYPQSLPQPSTVEAELYNLLFFIEQIPSKENLLLLRMIQSGIMTNLPWLTAYQMHYIIHNFSGKQIPLKYILLTVKYLQQYQSTWKRQLSIRNIAVMIDLVAGTNSLISNHIALNWTQDHQQSIKKQELNTHNEKESSIYTHPYQQLLLEQQQNLIQTYHSLADIAHSYLGFNFETAISIICTASQMHYHHHHNLDKCWKTITSPSLCQINSNTQVDRIVKRLSYSKAPRQVLSKISFHLLKSIEKSPFSGKTKIRSLLQPFSNPKQSSTRKHTKDKNSLTFKQSQKINKFFRNFNGKGKIKEKNQKIV